MRGARRRRTGRTPGPHPRRGAAELTGEGRDLGLDGGDLRADDPPAAARLDRGLELARDRQSLDRQDRDGDDEDRSRDRWDHTQSSISPAHGGAPDEGNNRTYRD